MAFSYQDLFTSLLLNYYILLTSLNCLQLGLVLVGLSSVLRDNHQGSSQGQVVLGKQLQSYTDNVFLECADIKR